MVTASTSTPAVSASSAEDYYVTDASGNVTRLVDLNGATMASYTYDPYGGHATATGTDAATNPYRFASAYLDSATGLYKMGARYYNPTRERFLSQDSVTHTGDLTQGNRYSYAGDNPVSNLDPAGSSLLGTVLGGAAKAITLGTSFFPGPIADAGALVGAGLDVGAGLADGESASEIAGTAVLDASTARVPFGAGKAAEAAGAADGLEGTLRGISVGYGALAVGGGSAIEYGSGD